MRYRKNLFNKQCLVLFENELKDKSGFFGKDEFSNSVIVKSSENLKGKIKKVSITNGNHNTLFGSISKKEKKGFCSLSMSQITKLDQNLIIKKIDKETINVQITDNEMLMSIVGQFDQNLKNLAKFTNTNVFFRGNSITCKGKKEKIELFL